MIELAQMAACPASGRTAAAACSQLVSRYQCGWLLPEVLAGLAI